MIKITRPLCPNPTKLATNYKHPDNKDALITASHEKCMYCESKITHIYFGDVEHIKPKTKYPSLEYTWENLGIVCSKCNNTKLDKYDEETPYIDPYSENPEDYVIAVGFFLMHKNGSERGELTILDIDLNRQELNEKRMLKIDALRNAIDACMRTKNEKIRNAAMASLKQEMLDSNEYSLFARTFLALNGIS